MKYIPILFSTPMVQAIMDDRKTMTRRAVKLKHLDGSKVASIHKDGSGCGWIAWMPRPVSAEETLRLYPGNYGFKCPYGKSGDVLWVRETFVPLHKNHIITRGFVYKAEMKDLESENIRQEYIKAGYDYKWKPSLFMPKQACRIFLKVADIRVERLQDISEEDAIAEGVEQNRDGSWRDYLEPTRLSQDTAKASFNSLWQKINGEESWNTNPWVWVISFVRIEKPAGAF